MCGIAGICNPGRSPEVLVSRMIAVMRHRGPDASGIFLDADMAMGHARLSIIDLGGGTQPICNEDGTLWIVYNGEIFNYPELRTLLLKKGHVFRTATDTEVLVHLYEEYGSDALSMVNGQFAFAIWDTRKKELFLARDRVGIRPLFYTRNDNRLVFASEIKAIFQDPAIKRELDLQALKQIFTFWTTVGDRTAFKDVHELRPGHFMVFRDGKIVEEKAYWSLPFYQKEERWQGTFGEACEELRELLLDAVRLRLRADVPVGAYLSGGLDSSIITSLISSRFDNNLRTFSVGFDESPFDETLFQDEMVRFLGTGHTNRRIKNTDIRDNLPKVIWHCEKPLLRTAPVPLFILSKVVSDNSFKIVLTGEGADEIFGGYNIFKEAKIRRFWANQPESRVRPLLLEKLYPYIFQNPARERTFLQKFYGVDAADSEDPFFSHGIRWKNTGRNVMFFSEDVTTALTSYHPDQELKAVLPDGFNGRDYLAKAQYLETSIFLSNYLLSSQGDRVAMANSVEMRVPFLDFRVIDFAMRLPPQWKIKALNEKYILKKTFAGNLPPRITNRPKHPYRAPIQDVFFQNLPGYADHLLSDRYLKKTGIFDPGKTGFLVAKFRKKHKLGESETENMALTGIISTQLLYQQFMEDFHIADITNFEVNKIIRLN
ncbi:asparagine synthase (glutamine-hydrolyzing) [Geotalea toluenoxydans]|uniref:asparagine synthase (glutamine-hydrolyzing) n=1 Tax=Geotalea toluenoxydans TaxID=421624 RepID=UPI0006D0CE08|nr:asparagine synthase (glutamine-hydrolyzing) [Geotalea toluenoxydans]